MSAKEVSRDEMMLILRTDETMMDVLLKSADKQTIKANGCILGSKSPVFYNILYKIGNSTKAQQSGVTLHYTGAVVNSILDYIYTETVPALYDPCTLDLLQSNLELLEAADYFQLRGLADMTLEWCLRVIPQHPELASACLDTCKAPQADQIEKLAMHVIRFHLEATLKSDTLVQAMTPQVLERIVKDSSIEASEYQIFCLIKQWSGGTPDRLAIATRLSNHLQLEHMDPADLASTVATSGLIPQERLLEAFKSQALEAKSDHGVSFQQPRHHLPSWQASHRPQYASKSLQTELVLLDCPPMTSGVHRWKIKIENCGDSVAGNYLVLGLAGTMKGRPEKGGRFFAFGYQQHGSTSFTHEKRRWTVTRSLTHMDPRYGSGSEVTFTLNFNKENGMLSASIDQGRSFTLYADLLLQGIAQEAAPVEFVPALMLRKPARVRLMEFDSQV